MYVPYEDNFEGVGLVHDILDSNIPHMRSFITVLSEIQNF